MSTKEKVSVLQQLASNSVVLFGQLVNKPITAEGPQGLYNQEITLMINDNRPNSIIYAYLNKQAADIIHYNYQEGMYLGLRGYLQSHNGTNAVIVSSFSCFNAEGERMNIYYDEEEVAVIN